MNSKIRIALYSCVAVVVFLIDRITKAYALGLAPDGYDVTSFLSYKLILNRGVVGGFGNSSESLIFMVVSFLVIALYGVLGIYTISRYKNNQSIIGELLVLAGGLSNIVDRFVYSGVLDFILVSYQGWSWPIFNIADAAIVGGVFIMMITAVYDV